MATYTRRDLDIFFDEYVVTALWWTSEGEELGGPEPGPVPLGEDHTQRDLTREAEDRMIVDCKKFLDRAWAILETVAGPRRDALRSTIELAAKHFWLTRNGWDETFATSKDWPQAAAVKLQRLARRFGRAAIRSGRDGRIHSA